MQIFKEIAKRVISSINILANSLKERLFKEATLMFKTFIVFGKEFRNSSEEVFFFFLHSYILSL